MDVIGLAAAALKPISDEGTIVQQGWYDETFLQNIQKQRQQSKTGFQKFRKNRMQHKTGGERNGSS